MHLFGRTRDHDYYFELPRKRGAGCPISYSAFYNTPSRFPRKRTIAHDRFSTAGCPTTCIEPQARLPWSNSLHRTFFGYGVQKHSLLFAWKELEEAQG